MKVSIVLPLCSRQRTGWRSIESALDQDIDRGDYEIVLVLGGQSGQEAKNDPDARRFISRCETVVELGGDPERFWNRAYAYIAGSEKARGDILFFAEGHTVLEPDCVRRIIRCFEGRKNLLAAYSVPRLGSVSKIGRVVDSVSIPNFRARENDGYFAFGGQSAINRDLFLTIGNQVGMMELYAENGVGAELRKRNIPIEVITSPLSLHTNDENMEWWLALIAYLGKLNFDHFSSHHARDIGITGLKRWILARAKQRPFARFLYVVSKLVGPMLIRCSLVAYRYSRGASAGIFRLGAHITHLKGFCEAALR